MSAPEPAEPTAAAATPRRPEPEPWAVDSAPIVLAGTLAFAVALVVTLAVPSLHAGDRDWWPWACVTGIALGLVGLVYMQRGRGSAAGSRGR